MVDRLKTHKERAHSKFSASGAERWFNCPGSVALSEGAPDKQTKWTEEGTLAHEVLENIFLGKDVVKLEPSADMIKHAKRTASFVRALGKKFKADILIETRIYLEFIHPEMFGTFDAAVLDHFGTLHVFDYKYGAGVPVSPVKNLQMIFYGIGLAHKFDWNFKRVRLWIDQPRIKGYDGAVFWEMPIMELIRYVGDFKEAVDRVEESPERYNEGSWCHWCKAKFKCPLKLKDRNEKAIQMFEAIPLPGQLEFDFGKDENHGKDQEEKEGKKKHSAKNRGQRQAKQKDYEEEIFQSYAGVNAKTGDFY